MMKQTGRIALGLAAAAALWTAACTSTEIGQVVETGVLIAEKDPEKAKAYGDAAKGITGSMSPMPFETERNLGAGIAVEAFGKIGQRHYDEGLQRYVNLVGRAVARQSGRPDVPYAFAVIDSDTPNAFAGPGGYIFVSTGALRLMTTEAELAGVLAHEVAHVTEKHMLKTYQRANLFQGVLDAAAVNKPEKAAQYTELVNFGSDTLFNRGLDHGMEFEADVVGTEIAAMAGYDPAGLRNFLVALSKAQVPSGGWMQTHPSTTGRVNKLNAILNGDLSGVGGAVQQQRFEAQTAALRGKSY